MGPWVDTSMTFSSEVLDGAGGKFAINLSIKCENRCTVCDTFIDMICIFISWIGLVLPCSTMFYPLCWVNLEGDHST